ncbi:MAG: carbohydrate ABC transporter permease, partial [bacterium]|nr:carbohydrate ABC transporter permease [bacterium]
MRLQRIVIYLLLAAVTVFTLGPFVWMISGSFKTQAEIVSPGGGSLIPKSPTLNNYRLVFDRVPFGQYLINTVFVSSATALLTTLVSAMGGYALAKYRFAGRRAVTVLVLGTMLLPPVVLLAPMFKL